MRLLRTGTISKLSSKSQTSYSSQKKQLPLPPILLLQDLACEFNAFFTDKINKIMVKLKQEELAKRHIENAPLISVKMTSFTPTTISEMVKLIHKQSLSYVS